MSSGGYNIGNSYSESEVNLFNNMAQGGQVSEEDVNRIKRTIPTIQNIIESIQVNLNSKFADLNLDLHGSVQFSSNKKSFTVNNIVDYKGKYGSDYFQIPIVLSMEKIIDLTPEELHAVISSLVYSSLLNAKKIDDNSLEDVFYEEKDLKPSRLTKEVEEENYEAEDILTSYWGKWLSDYSEEGIEAYSSDGKPFAKFDGVVSRVVVKDMIAAEHGDADKVISKIATSYNEKAKELLSSGESEKSVDCMRKSNDLLTARTMAEVFKTSDFSTPESFRGSEGMAFVETYVNDFLSQSGKPPVVVTFNTTGEIGKFYNSNPPRINVDLNKVTNVTDLAMACSHELTHYLDDAKTVARKKQLTGSNFTRSEVENIKASLLNPQENISKEEMAERKSTYNLLARLQNMSYHLDPDERSGRLGELNALRTVQSYADGRLNLKNEIANNVDTFNAYQTTTINMADGLHVKGSGYCIEDLLAQCESVMQSENIPSHIKDMINQRMTFVNELDKSMDLSAKKERDSVEDAKKIKKAVSSFGASEVELQPGM